VCLDEDELQHHHFLRLEEMRFDPSYALFSTKLFSKKSTFQNQQKNSRSLSFLEFFPESPPSCR